MRHLIDSVRAAVVNRNWYAALSMALSLPDVCAKLEDPTQDGSQRRYAGWFDRNLAATYQRTVGEATHTFLSGPDCYALRCAFSHAGDFNISEQLARHVLDAFVFVAVNPGSLIRMNHMNGRLQLQVDLFCEEICEAVERWLAGAGASPEVQARIAALPQVLMW